MRKGKILVGVVVLVLLLAISNKFSKEDDEAVRNCVNNGNNQNYCERVILGVY